MEKGEVKVHIREHLEYPATKDDLVEACNNMAHIPEDEREWVKENLPDGNYSSADDVIKALGL